MDQAAKIDEILGELAEVAACPGAYATDWKARTGRKVIGILPMNFPAEIVHAAGALPVTVQEDDAPITYGRRLLHEFYCGYTRSLVDQAATGRLAPYDGIFLVDHCVALLGAVDAIRFELPDMPVFLAQFTASMDETTTRPQILGRIAELRERLEELCGAPIEDQAIRRSIEAYNRNRGLLRRVYEMRRSGLIRLTSRQMQVLVKSAMVMDVDEHSARMDRLLALLEAQPAAPSSLVRLHLSGHFCHAPKPELLDMIESCGATVVDDDIYTGYRYISTDVPEGSDPVAALAGWYFNRNTNVPCSTRAQMTVDWESYLANALEKSGAQGVIVLVAKFCEPHMLYYPELRKEFVRRGIPHLLIETEHEGLALEMLKTRVEALIEVIRRPALTREMA
ncbi:2-hydroxyacyl-CoA dehydratase subunit D [Paracoccus sp. DMF]|uniref:2-hydroxyacyl-CoA dehydratase subunit D n=1 Tax=Paracoccus sp. DMF TaxID=400837 RepID=UPI0011013137|nr:2-hydroxyacyl-CoA dehydratase family protein [Paracoccus sp. DMF]MCV2449178.1 2-hydroxyacyl-CoA dehydratase family protein [Paracoccus sp. DMF]